MIRTQIQLTPEQSNKLRRYARARGISLAEAIRRCVDAALEAGVSDRKVLYVRAAELIGKYADRVGSRDLSRRHDLYLADAYRP
ncbi:MAG: CopG family transcriptional regulator [Planctomycetes bacterium]|nr:CopG family transcriptional regulator [Planctomycetota bacterium]